MQLVSISRGPFWNQQRMFAEMSAQVFPFKFKKKNIYINWGVRPIQLVEHVFPKDSLQLVLRSIPGRSVHGVPKIIKKFIQHSLKLKTVPETEEGKKLLINGDGVQNIFLGIREDEEAEEYEML